MTKSRRIAYSVLSVVVALTICAIGAGLVDHDRTPRSVASGAISVLFFGAPFCLIGWLFALPLVLRFDLASGRQLPTMLIVGSLLGPVTMYLTAAVVAFASGGPGWADRVWSAFSYIRAFPTQDRALPNMLLLATAISVLTTVIYVLSLRHQRAFSR